jgi:hypothetical protein
MEDLVTLCPTCHRLLHAIGTALRRSELPPDLLSLAAGCVQSKKRESDLRCHNRFIG